MTRLKSKLSLDEYQPVYVGIDVHKEKWSVCFIHQDEIMGNFTIPGDFKALEKLLKKYSLCRIYSVYEAGFLGFHLHYKLENIGVKNIIVAPNKIPVQVGDLVKTDRRDAKKLAFSLSKKLINGINIPDPTDLDVRQIIRTRELIKRKRVRCINQIKMILLRYGFKLSKGLTKEKRETIRNLEISPHINITLNMLIDEIEFHETKIYQLEKTAHKECKASRYGQNYKILQTIPGIGPIIAAALCFEIGDWNRFKNSKQLAAYLGLTPREYSSGEHVYKGRITGQGNPWLRSYLIEASWKTIGGDPVIKEFYNRVKMNSGSGKKAIVAVARKMLQRMHSIIKNNQCYSLGLVG